LNKKVRVFSYRINGALLKVVVKRLQLFIRCAGKNPGGGSSMKKVNLFAVLFALSVVFIFSNAYAGAPFTNLEGVGGIAFNPVAYPADSDGENSHLKIGETDILGKPRLGAWYVRLGEVRVDWAAIGVAETLFKRLEISYGFESINQSNATALHKHNVGAKLLLLPENSFDQKFIPAVSVGVILKNTSPIYGVDSSSQDYYAVATKLITQLPLPVLVSAGALSTKGKATGVFGYDEDRRIIGFGNIDVILPLNFIAGFEYKQGPRYTNWKDSDYWDAHVAWTPTKSLSLIAAYVNAGDFKSTKTVGLGNGLALSVQYAF
jgi:hypothetical protein